MVDNHEMEQQALGLMKNGEWEKGMELQQKFLNMIKNSGEDHCSCKASCIYHGKCLDCIIIHRGHGDHLPECFRAMLNQRIAAVSALTEHSFKNEP